MVNKLVVILVLFGLFLLVPGSVLAAVEYEKVNPVDGFNYGLKRFREKAALIFSLSKEKKANLYFSLTDKRLAELKYTVEKADMANFESATTRYFTTVGQYVEFLKSKNVSYNKEDVVKKLNEHIPLLEQLRDKFGDQVKAEWRFLQDDINYLNTYIQALP